MLLRSRTYIARRRPVELEAEPVTHEHVVKTWEGPRTAYPGDYVVTGVKGERWPVPGQRFPELYDIVETLGPSGRVRIRKRIFEVPVFQVYQGVRFHVRGEDFHAGTGYFIVSHPDQSCYPCEPDVFFETFEILRPATEGEDFEVEFL